MARFQFTQLDLKGAYLIENFTSGDKRGNFTKCFEKDIFGCAGIVFSLNETFFSISSKNVVRGLHFQIRTPQAKLVSVVMGKVYDVIVDLRLDSPTYKKWVGVELSTDNHKSLYIPKGFAHGFISLENETVMLYQCDGVYDHETDTGIRFDTPEIGIKWPIDIDDMVLSSRDMGLMNIYEYEKNPMQV